MIDNSTYLIKEIENKTSQSIKELKDEYKAKMATLKKEHKATLKELEAELDRSYEIKLSQYKKQRENMIAMKQHHLELQAKEEVYNELISKVQSELLKPSSIKQLLSLVEAKTIHVPKGVKLTGVKADLESNKIIGVISTDVEKEFDIDAALAQESLMMSTVEELL